MCEDVCSIPTPLVWFYLVWLTLIGQPRIFFLLFFFGLHSEPAQTCIDPVRNLYELIMITVFYDLTATSVSVGQN